MIVRRVLIIWVALLAMANATAGTAFTWQGLLDDAGAAEVSYDFEVVIYDAATGGMPLAGPFTFDDVDVIEGRFLLTIDPGPNVFDGSDRWLELHVRRGTETESYTQLLPRQPVHAAPFAQHADSAGFAASVADDSIASAQIVDGSIGSSDIDSSMQRRVSATCDAGFAIRVINSDGSVSCEQGPEGPQGDPGPTGPQGPEGPQGEPGSADAWARVGNSGTTAGTNFLGTTDDVPLEIRVNNQRVLWLDDETNLLGGSGDNTIETNVEGATIAGGGSAQSPNRVYDHYGSIGGGSGNVAGSLDADPATGILATVGGGASNYASNHYATVGGGRTNTASGNHATIGGGDSNSAWGDRATVGGGDSNYASGDHATVGGGDSNYASNHATSSGGESNSASGDHATVGGGFDNEASAQYATVSGGRQNFAEGTASTVGGGHHNTASVIGATVGGGSSNTASGGSSTVSGGFSNIASGGYAAVSGGNDNTALGAYATVSGGFENCAGADLSWAGGERAKALPPTDPADGGPCAELASYPGGNGHEGSFVWADSSHLDFLSSGANTFEVRATGGVRFVTAVDGSGNATAGVSLGPGDNSWGILSDRHTKTDIESIDTRDVLAGVLALPIYEWRYKTQEPGIRHLGPMAQDFHAAFGLNGEDDKRIATVDPDGVALAAIQGLYAEMKQQYETLRDDNDKLRADLTAVLARLETLERESALRERSENPR